MQGLREIKPVRPHYLRTKNMVVPSEIQMISWFPLEFYFHIWMKTTAQLLPKVSCSPENPKAE